MTDIQTLGAIAACSEAGISPDFIPQLEGAYPKLASADAEPIGRLLLQGASAAMDQTIYANTAPAIHLKLAAYNPVWSEHSQDLVDHVSEVLQLMEPMEKQAVSGIEELAELPGLGARTLGYGAIAGGGLIGALLWKLKRHSQEEQAEQESLKRQTGYYHNLSKELHESMQRKYDYNGEDGAADENDKAEGVRPVYN